MRVGVLPIELDGGQGGRDGALDVAAREQYVTEVKMCSGVSRIDIDRFPDSREGQGEVTLVFGEIGEIDYPFCLLSGR